MRKVKEYRALLARPMTWDYAKSEIQELVEEVRALNWAGISEEVGDVLLALGALAAQRWQIWDACPLIGPASQSWEKFAARNAVWQRIFALHGLEFHKSVLANGSNFRKMRKVAAALAMVGYVGEIRAETADIVGGFVTE
jgi:hypothetical protein